MPFRYATNAAEFDFPEFIGAPPIRYVIATSPRCGSNLLQRALWRTRVAGAPEEYLTEPYVEDFASRWALRCDNGRINTRYFLGQLIRYRTSPNGTFGLKVHGGHLSNTMLKEHDIGELLDGPKYVLLRRQDKFLQAVSYALARQTGVWILDGEWLPDKQPSSENPVYNFEELARCLDDIIREEEAWEAYFSTHQIEPLVVDYEELVADYNNVVHRVLRYLGIDVTADKIVPPGIRQQATSLNSEWARRFTADLARARRF